MQIEYCIRDYECYNATCPLYGCILARHEQKEQEQEAKRKEDEEAAEFMRQFEESIPDKKQEAMEASNAYYEIAHRQAIREDVIPHAWEKPSIKKAESMQSYTARDEFDILSLLPANDQRMIEKWMRNSK